MRNMILYQDWIVIEKWNATKICLNGHGVAWGVSPGLPRLYMFACGSTADLVECVIIAVFDTHFSNASIRSKADVTPCLVANVSEIC